MDVIEYEPNQDVFIKVAQWSAKNGLVVTRSFSELLSQKAATIRSKVFTVITRTGMPYLEYVENGTDLVGNDRYEGFVKDLMDNIARVKNFTYRLVLVPDNHQGSHDPLTGKWTGMIGEILEGVNGYFLDFFQALCIMPFKLFISIELDMVAES